MATHSSILPGELHRQGSLVGFSFMGLQRVGHDRVTNTFTFFLIKYYFV